MVHKTREVTVHEPYVECDKCGAEVTEPLEVTVGTAKIVDYGRGEQHEDKEYSFYMTKQYCDTCTGNPWAPGVFEKIMNFFKNELDND